MKVIKSCFLALALAACFSLVAENSKHSLVIGMSGVRPDALQIANTPNIDALVIDGAISLKAYTGGLIGEESEQFTSSGPSWTSILTGVWADKHKVANDEFVNPDFVNYPHFFTRLKSVNPSLTLMSITEWDQLTTNVFDADTEIAAATDFYSDAVDGVAVKTLAIDKLTNSNPDVLFVEFDGPTIVGADSGYSTTNSVYISAIEAVDGYVGELIAAMKSRTNYASENWLVLATTDHGGLTDGTNGGQSSDERSIFMLASNDKEVLGGVADYLPLTVFPSTVAAHLGVTVDPAWGWAIDIFSVEVITPTNFTHFVDDIHNTVTINWTNNSPAGIYDFEVLRDGVVIATIPATTTQYIDSDLPVNMVGVSYEIKMNSIDGLSSIFSTTINNFGPKAIYAFESDVTDSLNNHNGTEEGQEGPIVYVDGVSDVKAASFDGSNSSNLGTTLSTDIGTSDFSISLWVNAANVNNDKSLISNKNWGSGSNRGWILSSASGKPHFNFTAEVGGRIDVKATSTFNDNSWHHVVVSVDRDGMIDIYLDGTKNVSGDISALTGTVDATLPVRIGKDGAGGYPFTGKLDDVRIFDYVVDAEYVKILQEDALTPEPMNLIGNALDFTNGGSVSFANAIEVEGDWTVETWLKPTADFIAGTDNLSVSNITYGIPQLRLEQWENSKKLGCTVAGSYDHTFSTSIPALNSWTHLAYVRKDNVLTLYVNGVKDSSTKAESRNLLISAISGSDTLLAQLDEFRVWSEARSVIELKNNWDSIDVKSENLVAYYKFDQLVDDYLFDYSGNKNHGNLTGMTPATVWVDSSLTELAPTISETILNSKGFVVNWAGFSDSYQVDVATDAAFTSFVTGYESKSSVESELTVVIPDLNIEYFVRVRGVNGAVISVSSSVQTVYPALMGLGESFESDIPSTWVTFDTNGGDGGSWAAQTAATAPSYVNYMPTASDGTKFAYCRYDNGITNEDWLVLPPVNVAQVGNTILSFKACTSDDSYNESFKIIVAKSTDQSDSSLYTIELANITFASDLWKAFEFDLVALSNGKIQRGDTVTVAIDYTSSDKRFIAIDQVKIETLVDAPESVGISNVSETSFNVSWSEVIGCQYRVDIATDSTFTTFVSGWEDTAVTATNSSISSLTAGTVYYVRVRAENTGLQLFSSFTVAAPVATTTTVNNALYIHDGGTDDVVTVGRISAMENLSQFTVETWWKTNADYDGGTRESAFAYRADSNERLVLSTGGDSAEKSQIWMTIATGGVDAIGKTPSGCLPSTGVGAGQWVHVAAIFDGTAVGNDNRLKMFVNGIQQTLTFTGTIPTTTSVQSGSMRLGQNNFDASLDEFRFWTVVRSDKQVRDNIYNELDVVSDNTGLLVYYDFDIVAGNTLVDKSGNGWTGSLNSTFADRSWNCWQTSAAIFPSDSASFSPSNSAVIGGDITSSNTGTGAEIAVSQPLTGSDNVALLANNSSVDTVEFGEKKGKRLVRSWYSAVHSANKTAVVDLTFSTIGSDLDTTDLSLVVLLYSADGVSYSEVMKYSEQPTRAGDIVFSDVTLQVGFYTLGTNYPLSPAIGTTFERQITAEGLLLTWSVEEEVGVTAYVVERKIDNVWVAIYAVNVDGIYEYIDANGTMDDEYRLSVSDSYGLTHYISVDSPGTVIYYDLVAGWNLLSIPLVDANIDTLEDQCGVLWSWSHAGYQKIDILKPFSGFWVFSEKNISVELTGSSVLDANWSDDIQIGWNLLGPFDNTEVPVWVDAAYSWKQVYNNLLDDAVMMRGIGYWLFVSTLPTAE